MFSAVKDPQAKLDYSIDWEQWLDGGTITASTWAVSGPDSEMTASLDSNSTTGTTVRLSGGTPGSTYNATNHIVLADGQEDDRTITVIVQQK